MEFIKPTEGPITSFMDRGRFHPLLGKIQAHQGIDIGVGSDNRILAAAGGRVYQVGYSPKTAGNYVLIKHPSGKTTSYSHMSRVDVKQGDNVKQGDRIGMKGSTGSATGPHLHFEISSGNWTSSFSGKLNPLLYFKDPETKEAQQGLIKLGYELEDDGFYGEKMLNAVGLFQKRNGLDVDGYIGRNTFARIKREAARETAKEVAAVDKPKAEKKEEAPASIIFELEFTSGTLRNDFLTFVGSKLQQDMTLENAIKQGYASEIWNEKMQKANYSSGDAVQIAIGGYIQALKNGTL